MGELLQDMRFAWRNAFRKPGTSLLIVLTLALGIGANAAMFNMAWHVLAAPLPYEDGDRLVKLEQNSASGQRFDYGWSAPTLEDFREQNTLFLDLSRYTQQLFTIVGQGMPFHGLVGIVSSNFFDVLGVQPLFGRTFITEDDSDGAQPVVLLSHDFWERQYASNPDVLGKSLEMKDVVYTIVGVLPEIPLYPHQNDVWVPAASDPYVLYSLTSINSRSSDYIGHVLGKLRSDVTLFESAAEVAAISDRLVQEYPDAYPQDYSVNLVPLKEEMVGDSKTTFLLLLGLAFLVVMVASANVASLFLSRIMARSQELAIREAVGATPGRIARQLLTEVILFSLTGGLLGLLLATSGMSLLQSFAAGYTSRAAEIQMDGPVLLFTFAVALVAGLFSASAALSGNRDINRALKEGGDKITASVGGTRRRQGLLLVQFALSFFILATTILIVLSLYRLNTQETGYEAEHVLALSVPLNIRLENSSYPAQMKDFAMRFLSEARAIPGVEDAGLRTGAPLLRDVSFLGAFPFEIESLPIDDSDSLPRFAVNLVSEDYFKVLNIPLLRGRGFNSSDDEGSPPVAIVNDSLARRYFPDGDVIGQRLKLTSPNDPWKSVVGVVGNVRSRDLIQEEEPAVYLSFWQFPSEVQNYYVKGSGDPEALIDVLTDLVAALDPQQSIERIAPLSQAKADWLAPTRLRAILISLFGILALIVTLSGVVGVVSYSVSRRVREIGVHMAVGANPLNVTTIFFREGMVVYLPGLVAGLCLMLYTAPLIDPFLYQVQAIDPGVYLLSTILLTLSVLGAIYISARRAAYMSPAMALHSE